MQPMKKDIKIVIPCYDRFDLLKITLQSLKNFNIIFDTYLFFDGIAPEEVKQLADKFNVGLKQTGEEKNCGADRMIYRSSLLFEDHVLIIDSDAEIINDFTPFVIESVKHLENDPKIVGISISKTFDILNRYRSLDVMPFNIGCGTIYDKEHIKEAFTEFQRNPQNEMDSTSGAIARKRKKLFINSYTKFTKHLGDHSGFHHYMDIVHV